MKTQCRTLTKALALFSIIIVPALVSAQFTETQVVSPTVIDDSRFGDDVAMDGDYMIVGAP